MSTVGADNWANATDILYGSQSDPTPSAALTVETGEPFPRSGLNRSAWWKVTVPTSEQVGVNLLGSTIYGSQYSADTYLAVYAGNSLGALTLVASADDNNFGGAYGYLSDLDFAGTAGTTYYIQATLYSSSDDVDYVLRVGKLVQEWTDWQQLPDYVKSNANGAADFTWDSSGFATPPPIKGGSAQDADYMAAVAAAQAQTGNRGSGSYYGTSVYPVSVGVFQADYEVDLHYVRAPVSMLTDYDQQIPDDALQYETQTGSDDATVVAASLFWTWVSGSVDQSDGSSHDVSGTATFRFCVIDNPDWSNYLASWSLADAHHEIATYPIQPYQATITGSADLSAGFDQGWIAFYTDRTVSALSPYDPSWTNPNGQATNIQVDAGPNQPTATFTLQPPLIRYQRRYVELGAVPTVAPPLRQWPRSDGLGVSSARRMWPPPRSEQASIRRVGGYI